MFIRNKLVGKTISLRCAEIADADFILRLRNDDKISKYLPKLNITVSQQKEWINSQRNDTLDYYFIIEDAVSQTPLGTISLYDFTDCEAESGRFACLGNPVQNVESGLLLYDFAFYHLKLSIVKAWVYKDNIGVLNYNRKFGFTFIDGVSSEGVPCMKGSLTKNSYELASKKLKPYFDRL